jgi:outer membrane protein with glycine zipper
MTRYTRITGAALASLVWLAAACAQEQQAGQSADSTARNLTLAPADSQAALRDQPAAAAQPAATIPRTAAPATRTPPPPPKPPATATAASGTHFEMAAGDTITSRTAKVGDPFTARVVADVKNAAGQVVVPAGSMVNGTISDVKPAPDPATPGTLTLTISSVTVRGTNYPLDVSIDSLETVHKGRAINTRDAAKVGVGAAAGAILGRVIGGNKKGTVIGGVVGGAVGAGVAANTKDSDIVLPAGAHIVVTLTKALTTRL